MPATIEEQAQRTSEGQTAEFYRFPVIGIHSVLVIDVFGGDCLSPCIYQDPRFMPERPFNETGVGNCLECKFVPGENCLCRRYKAGIPVHVFEVDEDFGKLEKIGAVVPEPEKNSDMDYRH